MTTTKHSPMLTHLIRILSVCTSVLVAHQTTLAADESQRARAIIVVPATPPLSYTLLNESGISFLIPLTATATHLDSKEKAKIFNEKLAADPLPLASSITRQVVDRLSAFGLNIRVLEQVPRPANAPDDIDYEKIATASNADLLLHVFISEAGLYSGKFSKNYLPRLNVRALLYRKAKKDYPFDGEVLYGADAKEGKDWAVLSNPKFAYPTFEAILADLASVREAIQLGVEPVANRLAEQIHSAIK